MAAINPVIPIPLRSREERRDGGRLGAEMPLTVNGEATTTQDLSETGVSFESAQGYEPGDHVAITIEYLLDGHHFPFACQAEVIRVQPSANGFLVAARLLIDASVTGGGDGATADDAGTPA